MNTQIQLRILQNMLEEVSKKYDEMLNEKEKKLQTVMKKSQKDALTKVCNRGCFIEYLSLLLKKNRRNGESFALIFIDVDNFKFVNDTYGHEEGDIILQNVAQLLVESFRKDDMVARYGGDEFVVLVKLPHLELTRIEEVLNSLVKRVEERFAKYNISLSFGIALYPIDGKSMKTLLDVADKRMYHLKRAKKAAR